MFNSFLQQAATAAAEAAERAQQTLEKTAGVLTYSHDVTTTSEHIVGMLTVTNAALAVFQRAWHTHFCNAFLSNSTPPNSAPMTGQALPLGQTLGQTLAQAAEAGGLLKPGEPPATSS